MNDPKELILKILEIIGYKDDREKFAADFVSAIHRKAISNCVGSLTEEQKNSLEEQLSGIIRSPEEVSKILFQFITDDQYQQSVEKASKEIMRGYLEAIAPILSEDQTNQLNKYFNSF